MAEQNHTSCLQKLSRIFGNNNKVGVATTPNNINRGIDPNFANSLHEITP